MTMKEYCDWKDENPEWDKDWSEGVAGTTYGQPNNPMDSKEVSKVQSDILAPISLVILDMPRSQEVTQRNDPEANAS